MILRFGDFDHFGDSGDFGEFLTTPWIFSDTLNFCRATFVHTSIFTHTEQKIFTNKLKQWMHTSGRHFERHAHRKPICTCRHTFQLRVQSLISKRQIDFILVCSACLWLQIALTGEYWLQVSIWEGFKLRSDYEIQKIKMTRFDEIWRTFDVR